MNNIAGDNMSKYDILDEIIEQLQVEQVPPEFIIMAKVRSYDGKESVITGEELDALIKSGAPISDVRVILDVKKIRGRINLETTLILAQVFSR